MYFGFAFKKSKTNGGEYFQECGPRKINHQYQRTPLLIYLADSPVPDKQTRKFSTEQIPTIYSAMAMVSQPGLSKLIMNILISLQLPPIPMKSFTDDKQAKEWLKQFV